MEKNVKYITQKTIIENYIFSTDDIEEMIRKKYKLPNDCLFDWQVGQWVSLFVTVTKVE